MNPIIKVAEIFIVPDYGWNFWCLNNALLIVYIVLYGKLDTGNYSFFHYSFFHICIFLKFVLEY